MPETQDPVFPIVTIMAPVVQLPGVEPLAAKPLAHPAVLADARAPPVQLWIEVPPVPALHRGMFAVLPVLHVPKAVIDMLFKSCKLGLIYFIIVLPPPYIIFN